MCNTSYIRMNGGKRWCGVARLISRSLRPGIQLVRSCCRRRVIVACLALALLLTGNFLLLLLSTQSPPLKWAQPHPALDAALSHLDASGRYKVLPFAAVGEDWADHALHPVCLATHASLDGAATLLMLETLHSWNGPASVAIFDADPHSGQAARFLRRIKSCGPRAFPQVSFHVIGPATATDDERSVFGAGTTVMWEGDGEGGDWEGVAPEEWCRGGATGGHQMAANHSDGDEAGKRNSTKEVVYPQNLVRNTAVRRCGSPWVLTVDADMVPPRSLRRRLGDFLRRRKGGDGEDRKAFVVPTYEVLRPENGSCGPPPDTKASLLKLKKEGKARPFHITIFKPNQGASKLSQWEKRNSSDEEEISVAYNVSKFPFWYEPVYVARPSGALPPFDERFLGFGMTRNTQAYEMSLRGYTFEVLDNAFLVHWGFQEMKQRPKWRAKQTQHNYQFFKKWVLEKAAQYDTDPENLIEKMVKDQRKRNVVVGRRTEGPKKKKMDTRTTLAHNSSAAIGQQTQRMSSTTDRGTEA